MAPNAKYMPPAKNEEKLRIVMVGHVDHGKSTLVGRLLYDTKSLPDSKYEEIEKASKKRGEVVEWSYLLDSFQAERDQAITIDTTQIFFSTEKRDFVIIDAPGHTEFLRNMISGTAQADAAFLVVDAEEGLQEQTRRHAYLLGLMGVSQIGVIVNKIDKCGYDKKRFDVLYNDIVSFLRDIDIRPISIIPVSARNGDNILKASDKLDWYEGKTLLEVLHDFSPYQTPTSQSLRFPIQDVYRVREKRVLVGRIESGFLRKGDSLLFSPTNEVAKVESIEIWPEGSKQAVTAQAGESIGITLDKPIFVERGHVASHEDNPPMLSNVFRAHIFWLSETPLKVGDTFKLHINTAQYPVTVQSIENVIKTDDLSKEENIKQVSRNEVSYITLRTRNIVPIDQYSENKNTGRAVLYSKQGVCGGGTVSMEGYVDQRSRNQPKSEHITKVAHLLSYEKRAKRNGYTGGVFWFTGLSGAGKSTLAMLVEQALFKKGYQTYVLDGDNVRHGLNADLGFSPKDRAENIRRVGEVSALMADAGIVCITAFISPYRADRHKARDVRPDRFHEIYIKASLDVCESRDPKGLYKKARKGEISQFTGIDSPYEAPDNPELTVDTESGNVEECVEQITQYIIQNIEYSGQSLGNTAEKDNLRVL